jgi:integrase/recombinase XerD
MTQEVLKNVLPKFIKDLETKGRSASTVLAYRADLEQLVIYLEEHGKGLPQDITKDDISAFRDTLLNKKYTPKSVSRKLNAVKTFFRWLASDGQISSNPSEDVSHPKIQVIPPRFLAPLEYRALRDVVRDDERVAAIVELILQTGLRISEVANLKITDNTDHELTIQSYSTQPLRKIPLNEPAKDALDRYLAIRPKTDSPNIFVSKNGKPLAIRNIRAAIDRYMQKAGIENFSVNDLRTTFMVENLKAGVDLVLLSQVSGHKRLSTTERYLELASVTEPGKRQSLVEL